MKTNLLLPVLLGLLAGALAARGQGTVNFNNHVTGPGGVVAPIYGPEPDCPTRQLHGNATTNGGSVEYHGALLLGTGFSAALFAGPAGAPEFQLALVATAPFRTASAFAGFIQPPAGPVVVPNMAPGQMGTFQVRAWDNEGGMITSWPQVLASPTAPRGESDLFTLTIPSSGTANLVGLTSFNIFVTGGPCVPEPSTWALGLIAVAGFLWRRRR